MLNLTLNAPHNAVTLLIHHFMWLFQYGALSFSRSPEDRYMHIKDLQPKPSHILNAQLYIYIYSNVHTNITV